ncbi:MAG: ATP-binding cassette domain-containing protein [Planctomycetes bacterium]|nr:ATP-binding cassette domain-containing protein [Planctomycetota bacterium]
MKDDPVLCDLASGELYPLAAGGTFVVGRSETADLSVTDLTCSRQHFQIVGRDGCHVIEPLSAQNPTLVNGLRTETATPLQPGDVITAGQLQFQFRFRSWGAKSGRGIPPGPAVAAGPDRSGGTAVAADNATFAVTGTALIGRERDRVQILLSHPQVSRVHARITLSDGVATLADLQSGNGTFVNGRRISGTVRLEPGEEVEIGPYALAFTGTSLVARPCADNIELVGRGLKRVVTSRDSGQALPLLEDITLAIRPREFVCLIGPSGSGKSTLLKALSGREPPTDGVVQLNGRDLRTHFESLKQQIAVVPQQEMLHESLSVEQALWYTARLRLPVDTSRAEIETVLTDILETVGLEERRGTQIRHLSGGQLKRAALANEILCKPSLLFLDEVTSGLDEQTDREMMKLFRHLADSGKTIVCITHSLANVEQYCHLVVILTAGGRLAFMGTPAEARQYFRIDRLGDVYDRLAEQPAENWQQAFRQSELWQRYVGQRLPRQELAERPARQSQRAPAQEKGTWWRQTALVTSRYAAIWRGDFLSLLAVLGQALLVAVLLGLVFGDLNELEFNVFEHARRSVNLSFLLAVSSFWFGCNGASKEIVKERAIFTRERDFNLRIGCYYTSKLLLLGLVSGLQSLLLVGVTRWWCHPPISWGCQVSVLLAAALAGVTLGLAISTLSRNSEMANTLVPMAVIPQIILSGAVAPLTGVSETLARCLVSTYWAKRGLDSDLPDLLVGVMPELEQPALTSALLMLLLHAAVALVVALGALHWQKRR